MKAFVKRVIDYASRKLAEDIANQIAAKKEHMGHHLMVAAAKSSAEYAMENMGRAIRFKGKNAQREYWEYCINQCNVEG